MRFHHTHDDVEIIRGGHYRSAKLISNMTTIHLIIDSQSNTTACLQEKNHFKCPPTLQKNNERIANFALQALELKRRRLKVVDMYYLKSQDQVQVLVQGTSKL